MLLTNENLELLLLYIRIKTVTSLTGSNSSPAWNQIQKVLDPGQ